MIDHTADGRASKILNIIDEFTGKNLSTEVNHRIRSQDVIDELLSREIFTTLQEAKVLIEQWRREYNQVRPHSALQYRPPAPETILSMVTS